MRKKYFQEVASLPEISRVIAQTDGALIVSTKRPD
jgi:hypothetical protein